jgi:IS30 family transposase
MGDITALFKKDLSPDQISGRLGARYPDRPEKQASPSAICKHMCQETTKDPALKVHFRQKHAKPHIRSGVQDRRGQIIGRVSIDEWPKVVEQKSRIGDGEGDTIESAGKTACIASFADRNTRFLLAKVMPNKMAAMLHKAALSMDIYFAHPYHSWERGINEHANGLIRQRFPEKTPFNALALK